MTYFDAQNPLALIKFCRLLCLMVPVTCIAFCANAQVISRYNTFSYGVNEGLLQTTIIDIEVDKNNFCWISFPNGIQKFDGNNFTNIPVQPGLPDDKSAGLFRCANGDLLLSHSRGISRYNIAADNFSLLYKQASTILNPVIFIGEDEGIIYFYDEAAVITGISSKTYKAISVVKTGFSSYSINSLSQPKFSDNIINHKVAILLDSKLYLWDLQKGKLVAQSPEIPKAARHFLYLKSESEVLFYDYITHNALQCWNFQTNTRQSIPVKGKDNKPISRCSFFPWQNKWLLCFTDCLFETDSSSFELKSELVNFQNQPVSGNNRIAAVKQDNFGNLYLQTVTGGIKKIIRNNYPVKYFGSGGIKNNNILSVLPDKINNRVLTGGEGLYVFDTLQRLIKEFKTLPGSNRPFYANGIIKSGDGSYFIFCTSAKEVWQLDKNLRALKPLPVYTTLPADKRGIAYFGNVLYNDGKEAIMLSQEKIYNLSFSNKRITEQQFSNEYIMGGLVYGNMIISHGNDELIFLDRQTNKELKKIPFKNTGGVRCFTGDAASNILMGSNKGIFKIDTEGKILQQWNKQTGLPDECIYAMVFDRQGNLWFSTNKGILRLDKNNGLLQLTKEDGLQENEFNTNVMAVADDGELFFGGTNGVSSFYPESISSFDEKINLLFTGIKVNNEDAYGDTAVWNIQNIKLPYRQNSLSFDFVAMGNNNPGQYVYQYKMDGIDEHWLQSNDLQTVRYSLSPGKYIFQVFASRSFDKDAKPMREMHILITPPFWKTWWFFTILAFLFITILVFTINRYNKRKYERKLMQLEADHKIQLERERISRDLHDSIGAYANAVLYNTELLQKEEDTAERNELMNDLKFASKDIITSLRETIWAMKKDNYTAEECLLRIRNFIQPLSRYYSHIRFSVEGEAPAEKELHYTKALNAVRIIQEAVTNAIKHGSPSVIKVTSNETAGHWDLEVFNDGESFDHAAMKAAGQGNGLENMEQRAKDSGFEFSIGSDETGTRITILV